MGLQSKQAEVHVGTHSPVIAIVRSAAAAAASFCCTGRPCKHRYDTVVVSNRCLIEQRHEPTIVQAQLDQVHDYGSPTFWPSHRSQH
jgi:hypothetical protein